MHALDLVAINVFTVFRSENFDTKNGREITLKGFLDLNLMEARDAEGDPNDLWITFNSMGYNKALETDQVRYQQQDK